MKKYAPIILNSLIVVFGCLGLGFSIFGDGFMNADTFKYYTIQSNILAMLTAAGMLVFEVLQLKGKTIPVGIQIWRMVSTIAITLTFLVFSLMLTPEMIIQGNSWYLFTPGNIFVHNLVPIGAILDLCLFGSVKEMKKGWAFLGMAPALLYVCFVYISVACGSTFSGNIVPYFFLDYTTISWFSIGEAGIGVAYWIIILAGVLALLGWGFWSLVALREKRAAAKQTHVEAEMGVVNESDDTSSTIDE